jgi:AcrR family transcriptional regulator
MGRQPKFSRDQILDSTCRLIAQHGPEPVTVAAIATELGAPTGSIYHRFRSKEEILAGLWLRIVDLFQEGFLEALRTHHGVTAALHTPRWVRAHPAEARVLLLHRREEFLSPEWTDEIRDRAERLANDLDEGLREFTMRSFGSVSRANLRKTTFVLIDVPYAAVRRHLEHGETPPDVVEEMIEATYYAVMGRTQ